MFPYLVIDLSSYTLFLSPKTSTLYTRLHIRFLLVGLISLPTYYVLSFSLTLRYPGFHLYFSDRKLLYSQLRRQCWSPVFFFEDIYSSPEIHLPLEGISFYVLFPYKKPRIRRVKYLCPRYRHRVMTIKSSESHL